MSGGLRVALGEYDTGWHDPAGSVARAAEVAARAAAAGAELVVFPEMCTTGYTMESAAFAEPLSGPSVAGLAAAARTSGIHLMAGVSTRAYEVGRERFFNSCLLFSPEGELRGEYRKQRLFAYAGEHDSYAPGTAPTVWEVGEVRIAPFVCYDLRFPELFRAVAPEVDAVVLVANWPASRRAHWDVLVPARAIENQCFVVAVNRRGAGGGLEYDGGSAVFGPWGERLAAAGDPAIATLDPAEVARVRRHFPFTEDRRAHREASDTAGAGA